MPSTLVGSASGVFNVGGDHDWFKVALNANTLYEIAGTGLASSPFAIFSANGTIVTQTDAWGSSLGFMPRTSDDYYIDVCDVLNTTGPYTLSVASVTDDYASNPTTKGAITVGGSATGTIDVPGDHDWLKVTLSANQLYGITGSGLGHFNLATYDANGMFVARADSSGSSLGFMPTRSGDYYLDVSSFTKEAMPYTLSVTLTHDDYANNSTTGGAIAVGAAATGTLDVAGDHDWFRVALNANTLYDINGTGPAYSYFQIYDANGTMVTDSDSFGSSLGFMPKSSGYYYIQISDSLQAAGSYTLNVKSSPDDYANNVTTKGTIAVGSSATGTLDVAGDHDWFKVTLNANTLYEITGSDFAYSYIQIYDADGTSVGHTDSYGQNLGFMPKISADYYIDFSGFTDASATYALNVTSSPDDYANNGTTRGSIAVEGSTTGTLDVAGDHDWFKVTLNANTLYAITATGLPDFALEMYDANGGYFGDQIAVAGSILGFMPTTSGDYYIDVSSSGEMTGTYTLNVASSPDDYADNVTTIGMIGSGTLVDESLRGTSGDDLMRGNAGEDLIYGMSGNDTLIGNAGNDTIDGGADTDTAIFSDNRASHTLTKTPSGWTATSAADGNDILTNVERLQFSDRSIALDINGNAGQAYRLYQAAFNRAPDEGGLGYWIDRMDHGMTLDEVSSKFLESAESKLLYGQNPGTADFVNSLYLNALHRAPDEGGLGWWVDQIDRGIQTRTQVLAGFSESPENQAQVIGVIQNGIEYIQI